MLYGIIKTIDNTGRLVLPNDYRQKMGITSGTKVALYENDGKLVIEVITPKCKLCGSENIVSEDFLLCNECVKKAKEY